MSDKDYDSSGIITDDALHKIISLSETGDLRVRGGSLCPYSGSKGITEETEEEKTLRKKEEKEARKKNKEKAQRAFLTKLLKSELKKLLLA